MIDADPKYLLSILLTDLQGFITYFCELVPSQHDEYVDSSSFTAKESCSIFVYCVAHIFEELDSSQSVVMDDFQYNQGIYI